ncbi:TonB-dependent receptor [Sphingomonas mucosissima]|uniref:TonB-dependent receptor n=1 Tax=Sphingomonas mucosissima TaxID=370959 RepID=UPI00146EB408|nr:TonB-dependent receptor [Sphingomonas mucosissima]
MRCTLGAIVAATLAPAPAAGQSADERPSSAEAPGDIQVTAQRRPELSRKTPLALAAFDGGFIARTRIDDVKDLAIYAPGLSGNSEDSYIDSLAIRGIVSNDYGIGGDPAIGLFKDGVHQGRSGSAVTSFFDIARAEVLRGPQGFLFGRNAISGAISVITAKPELDRTAGYVDVAIGQPSRFEAEGAINLLLGRSSALRIAGYGVRADGWIDNAFTPGNDRLLGQNKTAGRISLAHERGAVRLLLTAEHERRRLDGTVYRGSNDDREVLDYLDQTLGTAVVIRGDARSIDSDLVEPRDRGSITSITAQADLELGFATLTSLTGYRGHNFSYFEDYDGTALPLGTYRQWQSGTYASHEFRLVSPGGGLLSWSAGVSGYRERVRAHYDDEAAENLVCVAGYGYSDCEELTQDLYGTSFTPSPDGMIVQSNAARNVATGLSAFADVNVRPMPRLQLGAGLRYTWDRKDFSLNIPPTESSLGNIWTFSYYTLGAVSDARSWHGLTPRLFARYEPSDQINLYASVTRGYKAGGFGTFTVDAPAPIPEFGETPAGTRPDAFDPETVWSKELGVKANVWSRRLQFDVAAFHYVYRDLQTNHWDTATRTQQVINVGKVSGYGVEAAATLRPTRFFDVYGNVTWTRTVTSGDRGCTSNDCGGLANPTWASNGVATAHYPLVSGELFLSGEWSYQGRRREAFDWRGVTRRDAYVAVNLRAGFRLGSRLEVGAYVQNLFDASYYQGASNGGDLTPANWWGASQPRNIGINLRRSFGG